MAVLCRLFYLLWPQRRASLVDKLVPETPQRPLEWELTPGNSQGASPALLLVNMSKLSDQLLFQPLIFRETT